MNNLIHKKIPSSAPQLLQPSPHKHHRRPSVKKLVKKITKGRSSKPKDIAPVVEHGSVMKGTQQLTSGEVVAAIHCNAQLMNIIIPPQLCSEDMIEFHSWVKAGLPTTPPDAHPFFEEVYRSDILKCLSFRNSEVGNITCTRSLCKHFITLSNRNLLHTAESASIKGCSE